MNNIETIKRTKIKQKRINEKYKQINGLNGNITDSLLKAVKSSAQEYLYAPQNRGADRFYMLSNSTQEVLCKRLFCRRVIIHMIYSGR